MVKLTHDTIALTFDMHGCPNRCRHCWLGEATRDRLSEQDVRWGVERFREYLDESRQLSVSSWIREPDYWNDYRALYALEAELSDMPPARFELLSILRLAHDAGYAEWAKSVGPDTCQISFFGMEETTDWFYRRHGAFRDALAATERLLEVGMKPRWQLFLTTKLLPELDALLALIDHLQLRERVQALGSEFQLFMHTPGPDGAAREIEYLRPTVEEVAALPEAILAPSWQHFGKEILWQPESELYQEILRNGDTPPSPEAVLPNEFPVFIITGNWDVYTNIGTLESWWQLGNLQEDTVETLFRRYEEDDVLGLQVLLHTPPRELAQQYGDREGSKIYTGRDDLLSLYLAKHCEQIWRNRTCPN